LAGWYLTARQDCANELALKQKGAYRIMCLGESTTQEQYPHFLEAALNQRSPGVKFRVIDRGIRGTRTPFILERLERDLDKYHPDMVVTMMGINDLGEFMPYESITSSKPIIFLRSFKTYKLARILWMHMVKKAQEIGLYEPDKNKRFFKKIKKLSLQNELAKHPVKPLPAEIDLKKNIAANPQNVAGHINLGWFYRNQGRFLEAEAEFHKAIRLDPRGDRAHIDLGLLYLIQGKFDQAERSFNKAVSLNPGNDKVFFDLGYFYLVQGRIPWAENSFRKAIKLNPRNVPAYSYLGYVYQNQGRIQEAEEVFKKVIMLDPENENAYIDLGGLYQEQGKYSRAENLFKKAVALAPDNDRAYYQLREVQYELGKFSEIEDSLAKISRAKEKSEYVYIDLGWLYQEQGMFPQAERSFQKAFQSDYWWLNRAYGAISVFYEGIGKQDLAQEYIQKANAIRSEYYIPVTVENYRKLKEVLDRRCVKLVCVQYPMRNVGLLKKIFENNSQGIVFVDNERIFREAVKNDGPRAYFRDMFAGDFGHCTDKGNQLLARNIADAIMQEAFDQKAADENN